MRRRASDPGACTALVASSASITVAPSLRSMAETVLLPVAIPPVRPTTLISAYDVAPVADEEKLDAIVVGAGPSGTAAAFTMAKAGLQVALVEKGVKPGSKNVMGGIFYNHYLEQLMGDDWKQAQVERPIIDEQSL